MTDRIVPPSLFTLDAGERLGGSHGCLGLLVANRQTGSMGGDARVSLAGPCHDSGVQS